MKHLIDYIKEAISESQDDSLEHVIQQDAAGNWRIKGHPGKGTNTDKRGWWKAKYKTKEDAENALKAYFANKNESSEDIIGENNKIIGEGIKCSNGKPWEVYVDNKLDKSFTEGAKNFKKTPKVGNGYYAGGAVFRIVKIEDNKIYMEEDKSVNP